MLACESLSVKRKIFVFIEIIGQVPTIITLMYFIDKDIHSITLLLVDLNME